MIFFVDKSTLWCPRRRRAQESIALLLTCKQFEVEGAGDAIRKMMPLVFARDQGGWARGAGIAHGIRICVLLDPCASL